MSGGCGRNIKAKSYGLVFAGDNCGSAGARINVKVRGCRSRLSATFMDKGMSFEWRGK